MTNYYAKPITKNFKTKYVHPNLEQTKHAILYQGAKGISLDFSSLPQAEKKKRSSICLVLTLNHPFSCQSFCSLQSQRIRKWLGWLKKKNYDLSTYTHLEPLIKQTFFQSYWPKCLQENKSMFTIFYCIILIPGPVNHSKDV